MGEASKPGLALALERPLLPLGQEAEGSPVKEPEGFGVAS